MPPSRFELHPSAPFRLDLTAWALRRRPNNIVDGFEDARYERVLDLMGEPVFVRVSQTAPADSPCLDVEVLGSRACSSKAVQSELGARLARILGLEVDLDPFYRLAESDARLGELAMRFRGLRPVRFPSIFEALVNAIACQQLSLVVGIELLSRLAHRFGRTVLSHPGKHGFPSPEQLANVEPAVLRALGFSTAKARAIVGLAGLVCHRALDLEALESLGNDGLVARLVQLPGIGRWSAEYVALRGYGRLDVLPGDDVGARNNLARRFGLRNNASYAEVATLAKAWSPYAGLVYFHLLLDALERSGVVGTSSAASSWKSPGGPSHDEGGVGD